MSAHHLHENAGRTGRHVADGMVKPDGEQFVLADRPLGKVAKQAFGHRRIGLVAQKRQLAVRRMGLRAGSPEEHALGAGRLRERLERDGFDRVIEEPDVDERAGGRHEGIVACGPSIDGPRRTRHRMFEETELWLAPTAHALEMPPRAAINRLADARFRSIQLSATAPGLRPRELGASGRRDLAALLRRRELLLAGLDCWVPVEHLDDSAHLDRAVAAILAAIHLAADLGALGMSVDLGKAPADVRQMIAAKGEYHGIRVADHVVGDVSPEPLGYGLDPAAWLAAGEDPLQGIGRAGGRLVAARLVDLDRRGFRGPPGMPGGQLDVPAYRASLGIAGYRAPVVLDARGWPEVGRCLAAARVAWSEAGPKALDQ